MIDWGKIVDEDHSVGCFPRIVSVLFPGPIRFNIFERDVGERTWLL